MIITFLIGSVVGFIGGLLFGRRNVLLVEAALLDAKNIANEFKEELEKKKEEAELKTKKLKEELEQALKEKKAPKKKKEQA